ncbi:YihY/virulence factor BrkB family protein [Defluviimonas sp. WL0002]|uniref:YihY/virulence factor BrkB family protein n=1 Tax=Albidovulum marisflavi TaxID=2984159 RepID=A0ABT2ZCR9_9RHOB|nr:YihY/virulence factor BrkB family protein [Defluviimonas sp. WL0002]MCV2868863.1 YihY/virulence factor BrkB family protein [Defluviimonas sp. WL0002]
MPRKDQMLAAARAVWGRMDDLNLSLISAGVGFFAVMALFPALGLVVFFWSFLADPSTIHALLDSGKAMMPDTVHQIFVAQVNTLIRSKTSSAFGLATLLTIGFATWSTLSGVASLNRGINAAYGIANRPSLFRRLLSATGLALALCGPVLLAATVIAVAPVVLAFVNLGPITEFAISILRWAVALCVVIFAFALVYRYSPNRRGDRPAWLTPGAVIAGLVWLVVSVGFSIYLGNYGNYNKVYGSLGAAVALFMWFYLSAYVVLIGAVFNAQLERIRSEEDSADEPA